MNIAQYPPLTADEKKAIATKARAAATAIKHSSDPTHNGALAIYFKSVTPDVVLRLLGEIGEQKSLEEGYKEWGEDVKRLTREIDQAMHGEDAAKQASLCDLVGPAKELRRLSELGEGDGGAYYLQSLTSYFHESGNTAAYHATRKTAHLAGLCIDDGGADRINPANAQCPLCGDWFHD